MDDKPKPLYQVGETVLAGKKAKKIERVWWAGHAKCWAYDLENSSLWYYERQLKK